MNTIYNYNSRLCFEPTATAVQSKSNSRIKNKVAPNSNILAAAGSIVGTLAPMLIMAKRQKIPLLKIDYGFNEMMFVGTGAILGGLAGGIAEDRKAKTWNKIKEANFQWITNLLLPTFFVDRLLKFSDKKFPQRANRTHDKVAKAVAVTAGICAGMKLGEFITHKLNCKFDKNHKNKRRIQTKDVLLHIDDIPIALTLSKVPNADKLLPFCFAYSGYQAGK